MFQGWAMCGYKAVPSPLPASQHSLNIYLESSGRALRPRMHWDGDGKTNNTQIYFSN